DPLTRRSADARPARQRAVRQRAASYSSASCSSASRSSASRSSALRDLVLPSPDLRSPDLRSPDLRSPVLRSPVVRSPAARAPSSRSCSSSSRASSCDRTTSLSRISPRQPSTSSGRVSACVITYRRKCFSSSRTRRPWARQRLPVRSKKPCGWYSSTSRTRVRFGASSWKLTVPSTWPFGPLDRHTMCSSGTCSTIVDSHVRLDQKTFAFQLSFSSDTWSTLHLLHEGGELLEERPLVVDEPAR